jgi:hypothetical protein
VTVVALHPLREIVTAAFADRLSVFALMPTEADHGGGELSAGAHPGAFAILGLENARAYGPERRLVNRDGDASEASKPFTIAFSVQREPR